MVSIYLPFPDDSSLKKKKKREEESGYNVVTAPETAGKLTLKISKSKHDRKGKFLFNLIQSYGFYSILLGK